MNSAYPLLVASSILLATSVASAQSVVYRETFGNNTAGNISLSVAGWAVHGGGGLVRTADTGIGISSATGRGTTLANVNAGSSSSLTNGFIFAGFQNAGQSGANNFTANGAGILWTNEYTIGRGAQELSSVSFYLGNGGTGATVRVALQIGGGWYVSNQTFANNPAVASGTFGASSVLNTFNFTTSASAWRQLNFNAPSLTANGSQLSLVGTTLASALPSGDVTAFGLYVDAVATNNGTVRVDSFEIATSAIPEPSAFASLAGAGALAFGALRRRRARG